MTRARSLSRLANTNVFTVDESKRILEVKQCLVSVQVST